MNLFRFACLLVANAKYLKAVFLYLVCERRYFLSKGLKVFGITGPTNPILLLRWSILAALVVFQRINTLLACSIASVFFVLAV